MMRKGVRDHLKKQPGHIFVWLLCCAGVLLPPLLSLGFPKPKGWNCYVVQTAKRKAYPFPFECFLPENFQISAGQRTMAEVAEGPRWEVLPSEEEWDQGPA